MQHALTQTDIDTLDTYSFEDTSDTVVVYKPRTPRDVLRMLPRDATPAQQDSAVQAMLDIPPATHLSERPDTLYIPGLKGSPANVDLSQYDYHKNFFSDSPHFHAHLHVTQIGIAAEPIPYRLKNDDYVTGVLLLNFFLAALFIVRSRYMFIEKFKNLFHTRDYDYAPVSTSGEMRGQVLLLLQTSFTFAIFFFYFTQTHLTYIFNSVSPYILLASDAAICLSYFILKIIAYQFVNWIFFERTQRRAWMESYILAILIMGLAAFPLALLLVYFDLPFHAFETTFFCIVGITKLLLLFKCKQIFFNLNKSLFHLFLYFCTLELIPILILWRVLIYCNEILVVNI